MLLEIVRFVAENQPCTYTEIMNGTGLSTQILTHRIRNLINQGVLFYEQKGRKKLYYTHPVFESEYLSTLMKSLEEFLSVFYNGIISIDSANEDEEVMSNCLSIFINEYLLEEAKNGF